MSHPRRRPQHMSLTPPDRATCCECAATIHDANHIHPDPITGRRSDTGQPVEEPLWVSGECRDYLTAAFPAAARPLDLA